MFRTIIRTMYQFFTKRNKFQIAFKYPYNHPQISKYTREKFKRLFEYLCESLHVMPSIKLTFSRQMSSKEKMTLSNSLFPSNCKACTGRRTTQGDKGQRNGRRRRKKKEEEGVVHSGEVLAANEKEERIKLLVSGSLARGSSNTLDFSEILLRNDTLLPLCLGAQEPLGTFVRRPRYFEGTSETRTRYQAVH